MSTLSLDGRPRPQPFAVRSTMPASRLLAVWTVGGAVFLASAAVASTGDVPPWEAAVLRAINGWPDALEPVSWTIQQGGVLAGPVVAGLVIAWWSRCWRFAVPFVVLVPLKLGVEWLVIKRIVERERPWQTVGHDIVVRGPAFDGLSFPSGHSTTSMACAVLLVALLPGRWRLVPVVWSLAVGVARMYYGEHNPLDVLAGWALGACYGTLLWHIALDPLAEPRPLASGDRTGAGP